MSSWMPIGHRAHVLGPGQREGEQELVPGDHERVDADGHQAGDGDRHEDAPRARSTGRRRRP